VTSKGVPLGYPLLQTAERLEKYIYHAATVSLTGWVGSGLGQKDKQKFIT